MEATFPLTESAAIARMRFWTTSTSHDDAVISILISAPRLPELFAMLSWNFRHFRSKISVLESESVAAAKYLQWARHALRCTLSSSSESIISHGVGGKSSRCGAGKFNFNISLTTSFYCSLMLLIMALMAKTGGEVDGNGKNILPCGVLCEFFKAQKRAEKIN